MLTQPLQPDGVRGQATSSSKRKRCECDEKLEQVQGRSDRRVTRGKGQIVESFGKGRN